MAKEICISTTPHETRLAIVEDDQLTEIYYERENEYTLAGSIYKGKVTRVLPGMQSAFVDVGLERDAFLYVTDFLEEQEDSADFEAPKQNGAVQGGGGRRERGDGRGGRRPEAANAAPPRTAPLEARGSASAEAEGEETAETDQASGSAGGAQDEFQEGTRRWRGRRGRRRGVRGNREGGSADQSSLSSPDASTGAGASFDEGGTDEQGTEYITLDAAAAAPRVDAQSAPRGQERTQDRNQERSERRPDRGGRSSREQGASPATITLPGEALQKYGQRPSDEGGASSLSITEEEPLEHGPYIPQVTARPSTLVEHPIAWDGVSAALPGESLSRYRDRPAAQASPATPAETATSGTELTPAAALPEAEHTPELRESLEHHEILEHHATEGPAAEQPVVELHAVSSETAPIDAAFPPAHPEEQHGAEMHGTGQSAGHDEPHAHHAQGDETEFNPESASASHRVDPSSPSEFRLSSLFGRDPDPAEKQEPETQSQAREEHAGAAVEKPAHPSDGNGATAQTEPHYTSEHPAEHLEDQTHAEPHHAEADDHGHHHADAHTAEGQTREAQTQETAALDHLHAFIPGDGQVEEEVIDDEEYDFAPLPEHAGAHDDEHDLGDLVEEETRVSGASELGDVIREAQIDREVTSSDDDDFDDDEDEADEEEIEGEQPANAVAGEEAPRTQGRPGRGDRQRGGRERRGGRGRTGGRRQSAQTSDLPIISELLKQGQEILVQIAKEPIAKKGARITSHIALPGRFLVFMPTVSHVGVSRKIWSEEERQRLKRVLISEKGDASGGFIVRTAAENASEEELRADLRFLISLWNEIKQRSDAAKAPALIYHDLNLIERILRDQVSDSFSTIWVDSEAEYERIVRFLNRFQPSLVRRVKLYTKETPLFEQFGIHEEISKALKSKVWLKSGGSIVINQTEALVAIDINTGKYVGKTARLEDTILKTNLDAIPEIVRQIRLRDLGGIIVIDFIDMDERKNRHKVMQALEEELKSDRAPSKVLQFNDFGLVAITRKRVKQSLERTLSVQCNICAGTGMVKSPITVANEIYIEMRKMQKHFDRHDVMLRVHPEVVKTLKGNNARWLNELEEMSGRTIIVKSDPALHPEQFDIH